MGWAAVTWREPIDCVQVGAGHVFSHQDQHRDGAGDHCESNQEQSGVCANHEACDVEERACNAQHREPWKHRLKDAFSTADAQQIDALGDTHRVGDNKISSVW